MKLDKDYSSICDLLQYMVDELDDKEMDFFDFMRTTNDYYS